MPYRLIHDSDLDDVAEAVRVLRQKASNRANDSTLHEHVARVTSTLESMFARNGPACTIEEANDAIHNKRMDSHFSGALRELYVNSDPENKKRLRAAFAHVFKDYA